MNHELTELKKSSIDDEKAISSKARDRLVTLFSNKTA